MPAPWPTRPTPHRTAHAPDRSGAMGWLGLEEHVEPSLRRIVCGYFGRVWEEVRATTRLRDDLGATPTDLARLAGEIGRAFGVDLPPQVLGRVRTQGDLVDAIVRALGHRRSEPETTPLVRVRLTTAAAATAPFVEHVGALTPYLTATAVDDARRLATGGRVDVWVPADTSWSSLVGFCGRLGTLGARGVQVWVHRTAQARAVA